MVNHLAKALHSLTSGNGGVALLQNSGPWKKDKALTKVALLCIILETSPTNALQTSHSESLKGIFILIIEFAKKIRNLLGNRNIFRFVAFSHFLTSDHLHLSFGEKCFGHWNPNGGVFHTSFGVIGVSIVGT